MVATSVAMAAPIPGGKSKQAAGRLPFERVLLGVLLGLHQSPF